MENHLEAIKHRAIEVIKTKLNTSNVMDLEGKEPIVISSGDQSITITLKNRELHLTTKTQAGRNIEIVCRNNGEFFQVKALRFKAEEEDAVVNISNDLTQLDETGNEAIQLYQWFAKPPIGELDI